jgi:hypothetical protein
MVGTDVGDGMNTIPFTTGELRAALQRIVFIKLTTDLGPGFPAATIVAAQYWGQGKVVLTRFPDGTTITTVAHQIKGEFVESTLDNPRSWEEIEALAEAGAGMAP